MKTLLFGLFLCTSAALAQDCQWTETITSATTGASRANLNPQCATWRISYYAVGMTALSIQFEGAPDVGGAAGVFVATPNTICSSTVQPPCLIEGTNPLTDPENQTQTIRAYYAWVHVNVTVFTPTGATGSIIVRAYGYKGSSPSAAARGGSGGFLNPMTDLGDMIDGGAAGTPTRLPGNTAAVQKFLSQTGDGVNSAFPSWQVLPAAGNLTYYLTPTPDASIATYLQQTTAPFAAHTAIPFAGVPIGTTSIQNWITNTGFPGLTFIPAGAFEFHIHGLKTAGGNASLQAEFWETDAAGVDIGLIGTSEASPPLTGVENEYRLFFVRGNIYTMATSASRIVCRVQAVVTGFATDITLDVGGTADSHISLPSNTVDATNFVPYTGAVFNLDMGAHTATAANLKRGFGATFDGGGSALTAGKTVYYTVPYQCSISAWNITVDTGTATIDVWRNATATNAIPTVANTITGAGTPAIAANTAIHSTNLVGWTSTAIAANDIIGINLKVVASATLASLVVQCD